MDKVYDKTYIYKDDITGLYRIHDVEAGFDYAMSSFDIRRNIKIQKQSTGEARFYNAELDGRGNIVLKEL